MTHQGGGLVNVGGHTVEFDALRIAERVNDYDPNLRVQFLADEFVTLDQPPFQIVETCKDGIDRVVFSVWQLDNRVIERVMAADTRIVDVNENSIKSNKRAKKEQNQRFKERRQEETELVSRIIEQPKDTYSAKINGEKKVFRA